MATSKEDLLTLVSSSRQLLRIAQRRLLQEYENVPNSTEHTQIVTGLSLLLDQVRNLEAIMRDNIEQLKEKM